MRVTVFGASGKVGRLIVKRLLEDGFDVIAFAHHESPFGNVEHLTVIKGDVHNFDDVKRAVKDSDAIISALGSWGTQQKDIVSAGARNIIAALSLYGIKRLVTLTGSDALAKEDHPNPVSRIFHAAIKLSPARKILIDGENHIRLLEDSSLNWTALRSPIMNSRGKSNKSVVTSIKPKPWETINRQSVANTMVDLISDNKYYKQAPFIRRDRK